jgi:hypothetical protein
MEEQFNLDEATQLALDVAQHAALANGDGHCGTEYLLYGLVATARGDLVELADLFALNVLRVDRAVERLLEDRELNGTSSSGPPVLSLRARDALATPRLDGLGPTGPFELLHGLLNDDGSGACRVVRDLGVNPDEIRRLVGYGIRHLSKAEVDDLIATLDRRKTSHQSWWGPNPNSRMRPLPSSGTNGAGQIAVSDSAVVELTEVQTDGHGFGFGLAVSSLRDWVLPPTFVPHEALIPGEGARYSDGPDFFMVQVVLPDGTTLDNRRVESRFVATAPTSPRLIQLGQRDERIATNDRRTPDQHVVSIDWWAHPVPTTGVVEVRVDWPAESIFGVGSFDCSLLQRYQSDNSA